MSGIGVIDLTTTSTSDSEYSGSSSVTDDGSAAAPQSSPRQPPPRRSAAIAAGQNILQQREEHTAGASDDADNAVAPAAAGNGINLDSGPATAATATTRARRTAARSSNGLQPHKAVFAAGGVLSLPLQQARAGLALEITTELDSSPATAGMYKDSVRWSIGSGSAVKTVLKTHVMKGTELLYESGSKKANRACCTGVVEEGGRIRCLGCAFTGGRSSFADHTGCRAHRPAQHLVVALPGVGNLTLQELANLCIDVDLNLSSCVYCIGPDRPNSAEEQFITCSSCPASFHRACYDSKAGQPPLPADLPDDWQCASCQQAEACAAAGCSWCSNHSRANMDQLFADFKAGRQPAAAQGAAAGPAAAAVAAPPAPPAAAAAPATTGRLPGMREAAPLAAPARAIPASAPAQPVAAVAPVAAAAPDVIDILTELLALLNELQADDAMLERLEAMMEQVNRVSPGDARLESFSKRLRLQYQLVKTWKSNGRPDKVWASLETVLALQV